MPLRAAIIPTRLAAGAGAGTSSGPRISDRRPVGHPSMSRPTDAAAVDDDDRRVHDHPLLGPLPLAAAVRLAFDGRPIAAHAGEPIAVALLAAGVRVFRTMPRSGEARGGWCMVGRCGDCFVVVDGRPNVPACVTPVAEGMVIQTQHGLGDDAWDLGDASTSGGDGTARDERDPR